LSGPQFTPHVFIQSRALAEIAVIARDRKTKSSPLMNADDTDEESVNRKGKTSNDRRNRPSSPSSRGIGKSKSSPLMNADDTNQESVIGRITR
jgi:hypothetical protein